MNKDKHSVKTTDWLTKGMTEAELAKAKEEAIKKAEAELRDMQTKIEELARAIFIHCSCGLFEDEAKEIAEFVIDRAGYRKASDIAGDIIKTLRAAGITESRYPVIAELKRKYESEKKNGRIEIVK